MEPAATRPPLPKLVWVAAALAFLSAGSEMFTTISAQVYAGLPLALIPLLAGIGILHRNIWSARGFALYEACGIVVVLLLFQSTALPGIDRAVMVVTAFFSLLVVALFLFAARSLARAGGKPGRPVAWIAVSALFVLPWFFLRAFSIPSASMENTLLIGDSLLVEHWPKLARKRGDVIVFTSPIDASQDYTKRIVGVPGDRLRIVNKVLYRDGALIAEPFAIHRSKSIDAYRDNFPSQPNVPLHSVAMDMLAAHVDNGEVVVPPGKYFVLGDNRDYSLDSRYYGFVDDAAILGKPILIYNSVDRPGSEFVTPHPRGRVRWNRLFQLVR